MLWDMNSEFMIMKCISLKMEGLPLYCRKVSREDTKKMGIYEGRQSILLFSGLDRDQTRNLASTLDFLGIDVCGNFCKSSV